MVKIKTTKKGCKFIKNDNIISLREEQILPLIDAVLILYQQKLTNGEQFMVKVDDFIKVERQDNKYIVNLFDDYMFEIEENEILEMYKDVMNMYNIQFKQNDK